MITLNIWCADSQLGQKIAARLEYELTSLNYYTERLPSVIGVDDTFDWEADALAMAQDVCIIERPFPLYCGDTEKVEAYYKMASNPIIDVLIVGSSKLHTQKNIDFMQDISDKGLEGCLDIVMEETTPRYMSRVLVDEVTRRMVNEVYNTKATKRKPRKEAEGAKPEAVRTITAG